MVRWIKDHKLIMSIVAVVLALCVIIGFSYGGKLGLVGDAVRQGVSYIAEPVTSAEHAVRDTFRGIFSYKELMRENEELKEKVAELEGYVIESKLSARDLEELRELSNALEYNDLLSDYGHVAADIIEADNSGYLDVFTINAGTECGVKEDDIVVAGNGLVGRILEAGNGYAKVISVMNDTLKISFSVLRDADILGIVQGDGNGGMTGYTLKSDAGVVAGDMLVTTGIGMYPQGIKIGFVSAVNYNSDTKLMSVEVSSDIDFNSLRKVMVFI